MSFLKPISIRTASIQCKLMNHTDHKEHTRDVFHIILIEQDLLTLHTDNGEGIKNLSRN